MKNSDLFYYHENDLKVRRGDFPSSSLKSLKEWEVDLLNEMVKDLEEILKTEISLYFNTKEKVLFAFMKIEGKEKIVEMEDVENVRAIEISNLLMYTSEKITGVVV